MAGTFTQPEPNAMLRCPSVRCENPLTQSIHHSSFPHHPFADKLAFKLEPSKLQLQHCVYIMFTYMTTEEEASMFTCPTKRKTDALGGVKVQVYGLDSYGYLQYKKVSKDKTLFPKELEGCMTIDEWDSFWNAGVKSVLRKHQKYDLLIGIWVVTGIFLCTALMAVHDFRLVVLEAVVFIGVLCIVASFPRSCKEELRQMCKSWTQQRRVETAGACHLGSIEARFFHEKGPSTRHGQNSLGVVHFLPAPLMSVKQKQQEGDEYGDQRRRLVIQEEPWHQLSSPPTGGDDSLTDSARGESA